jgi:Family of unknown function (DUF6152)
MQRSTVVKFGSILSFLCSAAALAHHSNAMYDREKVLEVSGTVREFQWTNPHTFIELIVDSPSGPQNYTVEGATPGVLRRQGWKFNSLKPGDKVVVKYHPLKYGKNGGGLVSVAKDGVTLGYEPPPPAPEVGK